MLKIERSKRARVVLPEDEGPDRPMRRVLMLEDVDSVMLRLAASRPWSHGGEGRSVEYYC